MVSIRQKVFKFLDNNPNAKLPDVMSKFKGTSKWTLAKYLTQWRKALDNSCISNRSDPKKKETQPCLPPPLGSDHLTEEVIEQKVLYNLLSSGTSQDVRNAIDFYSKIKATHDSTKEIDMEQFFLIGGDNADS